MEGNFLDLVEVVAIVFAIVVVILTPVVVWLKGKFRCIDKVSKRSFRQSKALIILANRFDNINEDQHGKDHHLGDEVEEILKDEHGDL
jgi:uncharacterized membrane protein